MQSEGYEYGGKPDLKVQTQTQRSEKPSKDDLFERRFAFLSNFFKELKFTLTDFMPERDLLQLLDSLCVREFDREIARGLFAKIPKQTNPQKSYERVIEIQDFITTYAKAEYLLIMKSDELEKKLADVAEKVDTLNHHIDILKTRGGNVFAPVEGEEFNLNLEIVEIVSDDLEKKYPVDGRYTAVVKFDGYKYETLEVNNESSDFNPVFEHTFHLKIPNVQDTFTLCLRKYEDPKHRSSFKETQAKFKFDLADQTRNEAWVELYDENRKYTKEKMHVILELQTENTEGIGYFQDKIEKLKIWEEDLQDEREMIYSSLRDLLEPFSGTEGMNRLDTPKEQTPKGALKVQTFHTDAGPRDLKEEKEPKKKLGIFEVKTTVV